jgi:hypothetical protein
MIEQCYGDIELDEALHQALEQLMARYCISASAERIVLNCRQKGYYLHRQGLHPVDG